MPNATGWRRVVVSTRRALGLPVRGRRLGSQNGNTPRMPVPTVTCNGAGLDTLQSLQAGYGMLIPWSTWSAQWRNFNCAQIAVRGLLPKTATVSVRKVCTQGPAKDMLIIRTA